MVNRTGSNLRRVGRHRRLEAIDSVAGPREPLGILPDFVVLMATILTASVIGAEYGPGTLRPVLALGTGRSFRTGHDKLAGEC
jgi:hypothetical protein